MKSILLAVSFVMALLCFGFAALGVISRETDQPHRAVMLALAALCLAAIVILAR